MNALKLVSENIVYELISSTALKCSKITQIIFPSKSIQTYSVRGDFQS